MKKSLQVVAIICLPLLTLAFLKPHRQAQPAHSTSASIDTEAITRGVDTSTLPVSDVNEPF